MEVSELSKLHNWNNFTRQKTVEGCEEQIKKCLENFEILSAIPARVNPPFPFSGQEKWDKNDLREWREMLAKIILWHKVTYHVTLWDQRRLIYELYQPTQEESAALVAINEIEVIAAEQFLALN